MTLRERAAELRASRPKDGDLMTEVHQWHEKVIWFVLDLIDAAVERAEAQPTSACTCGIEQDFFVAGPGGIDVHDLGRMVAVRDAEGRVIAVCSEERYAEMVAWALNQVEDDASTVCRIHSPERSSAAQMRSLEKVLVNLGSERVEPKR